MEMVDGEKLVDCCFGSVNVRQRPFSLPYRNHNTYF